MWTEEEINWCIETTISFCTPTVVACTDVLSYALVGLFEGWSSSVTRTHVPMAQVMPHRWTIVQKKNLVILMVCGFWCLRPLLLSFVLMLQGRGPQHNKQTWEGVDLNVHEEDSG